MSIGKSVPIEYFDAVTKSLDLYGVQYQIWNAERLLMEDYTGPIEIDLLNDYQAELFKAGCVRGMNKANHAEILSRHEFVSKLYVSSPVKHREHKGTFVVKRLADEFEEPHDLMNVVICSENNSVITCQIGDLVPMETN